MLTRCKADFGDFFVGNQVPPGSSDPALAEIQRLDFRSRLGQVLEDLDERGEKMAALRVEEAIAALQR